MTEEDTGLRILYEPEKQETITPQAQIIEYVSLILTRILPNGL